MNAKTKIISVILCVIYMLCNISSQNVFILKTDSNEEVCSNMYFDSTLSDGCGEKAGGYISLDSVQTHFSPNENIVVSYSVSSGENIVDFNYLQSGFNVISINIDDNDESRIIVELSCVSDVLEATFDISVSLENGENTSASLYAISNEYGTFISSFSVDNAIERYCQYAIQNNILTEEQAINLFLENYKGTADESFTLEQNTTNISMTESTMSTTTDRAIFCGYLNWLDDSEVSHSLRKVMVEIYSNEGIIPTLLSTEITDNNGYFEFNIPAEIDVFLRIYAGDSNAMVKSGVLDISYCYETDFDYNISANSIVTFSTTFEMNNDLGRAFQISQAILTARDYAWDMMGKIPSNVKIWYPYSDGLYYNDEYNLIKVTYEKPDIKNFPYSYASWDAIMHEYGHHIQHELEAEDNPKGKHYSYRNDADERKNKDEGIRLAWAEAWPTVFALMAQKYYIDNSDVLNNINCVGNSWCGSYETEEYDIEINNLCLGEACEQSIMAILWDLYDSDNDARDTISLGHNDWWKVTTENKSKTFSDFINHFYWKYPEYIDDLGPNLTYYNMASTSPSMSNSSNISQTEPPTFTWDRQGGRTNESDQNNSFILIFYDELGNELIRTPTVTAPTYTLSQSEWNSIIYSDIDSFTVAVASMQTDYPSTGPYISERSVPYLKSDIHMHSDNYVDYVKTSDTHHTAICECGYEENQQHFNYRYGNSIVDTSTHRIYCICGHMIKTEEHIFRLIAGRNICTLCGYEKQGGL